MTLYYQCRLEQKTDEGIIHQVAWIEEKGAKHGLRVQLIGEEGLWYYLITGDERLRKTSGWESKYLGRTSKNLREHPNEEELLEAYKAKLK